ncbi:MAG: hypothetical protein MJ058_06895 [Akkermansia sp.]|nr:hypothetical protein [Akkermansia sp.]
MNGTRYSWAAPAALVLALAASPLTAAELPAGVPVYNGVQPAPKPLPKGVPVARSPHLVRPGMNAPRPGVAIPGSVPRHLAQDKSGEKAKTPAAGAPAAPNSPNPKK